MAGLELLAMSIRTVTSCLRILGGDDPTACPYEMPQDPEAFDIPFTPVGGVTSSSLDLNVSPKNIARLTKDQVLERLRAEGS